MKILSKIRLKSKMIIIIFTIGALSTITGSFINYFYDINNSKNLLISNSILQAKLVCENLWFPMEFNYPKNAGEVLTQLHNIPGIQNGILFTLNDTVFAQFNRDLAIVGSLPAELKNSNHFITGNYLHIKHKVEHAGKYYGYLYLRAYVDWSAIAHRRIKVSLIIIFFMLIIIFVMAWFMQRSISEPIVKLTHEMNLVASNKDYKKIFYKKGEDEISELYRGFDSMLAEINQHETDLKTAYNSLETNEQWLKRVLEKTPLPIVMINAQQHISYRNERFVKIFGYTESDVPTMTDWLHLAFPDAEYRKVMVERWGKIVDQLANGISDNEPLEYLITNKKGEKLIVEISAIMLGDTVVATFVDLTERKKIEAELRKHRDHLEQLVEERTQELKYSLSLINAAMNSTADGILVVNRNGNIARWNQKFVDLWQVPQELLNTEIKDPVLNYVVQKMANPEAFLAKVMELYENPEVISEDILNLADGRVFERYSQPQKIDDEIVGRVWSFRDVTERVLAEENLQRAKELAETANHAKSEFLSNMSHELRTPLNAILGFSKLLRFSKNITDIQKDQLRTVYQCGEHLLSLINDILDMSKIEAQKLELKITQVHLPDILNTIFNINKVKADEKDLEYVIEKHVSLPPYIMGDEQKLKQIMLNLINNAIKFTDDGRITVRVNYIDEHNSFIFEVEDTGNGIPLEKQTEIFEPFIQHAGKKLYAEGTGLGLSITKKLVEMMDGTISVQSEPEQGSIFKVEIPLLKINDDGLDIQYPENEIKGYKGKARKILIVDDNQTNLSLLVSLLEPIGFIIETAENGMIALQKLPIFLPEMILLDYRMPVMDGLEFATKVRENKDYEKLIIIGVSATLRHKELKKQFYDLCNEFIPKPVDSDLLFNVIQDILNIEWIYSYDKPVNKNESAELLLPEGTIVQKIKEYTEIGDFNAIKETLDELLIKNSAYESFCHNIKKHARNYDRKGILNLLESLENGKNTIS